MTRQRLVNCSNVTQAVFDAFWPLGMYPDDMDASNLALALRAAADQIETLYCDGDVEDSPGIVFALRQLMLIANELEAQ